MKPEELTPELIRSIEASQPWWPLPGPQETAYYMLRNGEVDECLYGGSVGSGKSSLAAGLALTAFDKTLYLRREFVQLQPVLDHIAELIGTRNGYNTQSHIWRLPGGRQIRFGACGTMAEAEKFQGAERSLTVIDEAAQIGNDSTIIDFLTGWSRSAKGHRTAVLFCTNPPIDSSTGFWLVERFSPWLNPLDPRYPAKPGEVIEMDGVRRTFVPGKLSDNPFLDTPDYRRRLEALPGHLKAALLDGDFLAAADDPAFQVIPRNYVEQAQAKWTEEGCKGEISSIGVDVARTGRDKTIIAVRRGWHFDKLLELDSKDSDTGGKVAAKIIEVLNGSYAPVHIDGIGYGASVYDHLYSMIGEQAIFVNVAEKSKRETDELSGQLSFLNLRAELWWRMRELLSPDTAAQIALPPGRGLLADLCSAQYKLGASGLQIESKPDIIKRLGRSPDSADAVILACMRSPIVTRDGVTSVGRFRALT